MSVKHAGDTRRDAKNIDHAALRFIQLRNIVKGYGQQIMYCITSNQWSQKMSTNAITTDTTRTKCKWNIERKDPA